MLDIVTVLSGEKYEELWNIVRDNNERMLGQPVRVIRPDPSENAFRHKLKVLENPLPGCTHVMFLDVDTIVMQPWLPELLPEFQAVLEAKIFREVHNFVEAFCSREGYFNSGVWIAPVGLYEVFHYALYLFDGELQGVPWGDQTPLNAAFQRMKVPIHYLDGKYNRQLSNEAPHVSDVIRHVNSVSKKHTMQQMVLKAKRPSKPPRIPQTR